MKQKISLNTLYNIMYDHMDPNGWWPGRSDWEVIWSTVLIQNTNWKNVAKVNISLFKKTQFLPQNILKLTDQELADVIKSTGFYTRKVKTIKILANFFKQYNFDLEQVTCMPKDELRNQLLKLHGIGPETSDVILMYALQKGEFVVDKYCRRLFSCLGVELASYDQAKKLIESHLDNFTLRQYQNFHAMIDMFNQEYKLPSQFKDSFLAPYQLIIPH
ncbi:endonuclease III domain-containing protein [uncultured Lactobacillus sp.]|uniref:endonuclease III domain-containing protein n=1 Tax=uncultured Lactobacillus sp. TaxID=153152 RepID=UPI00261BA663|nr:endonuclease III [uncultured Lactobacillus sp.]